MFSEFRELKLEELEQTRELRGHTERVMRAVENSVNAMEDPDSLREYLVELGRRHVMRSAKPSVGNVSQLACSATEIGMITPFKISFVTPPHFL